MTAGNRSTMDGIRFVQDLLGHSRNTSEQGGRIYKVKGDVSGKKKRILLS